MAGSTRDPDPDHPSRYRPDQSGRRPEAGGDRYRCSTCGRAIATEHVVRIDAERRWASDAGASRKRRTGFVLISHRCPCSAHVLISRRAASYAAFVALFGRGVRLPYESPFAVIDLRDDDPLVCRWRWELEQVTDVGDFVLWTDAERRKPLDESRRQRRTAGGDEPSS